jgi:hypothetical protein
MASASDEIRFPNWLPPDAKGAWKIFYSLFQSGDSERELRDMMQRLATWEMMKDAWAELEHFEEVAPGVLIAMTITAWLSAIYGRPIGPGSAPTTAPRTANWPPRLETLPIRCRRYIRPSARGEA